MKKLYSNKLMIFSLVLPGLLVFIFAILAPICLSVYYGFTDYPEWDRQPYRNGELSGRRCCMTNRLAGRHQLAASGNRF